MLTVKADAAFAYHGGITLWVLASAVMILYVVSDPRPLGSWPAVAARRRSGKCSYAIYLWQVPVIRAVEPLDDEELAGRRSASPRRSSPSACCRRSPGSSSSGPPSGSAAGSRPASSGATRRCLRPARRPHAGG